MDADLSGDFENVAAGQCHGQKHGHVRSKENLRQTDTGLSAPHPRCRHDSLPGFVDSLTALRGLMLYAPLTDLPPETQWRKLPPASNTVRHVVLKDYQEWHRLGDCKDTRRTIEGEWRRWLLTTWKSGASAPRGIVPGDLGFSPRRASEWSSSSATCSPSADTAPAYTEW